uniref:MANSC domain-containing protein n=1 Tax=Bombyx mori TaxID=7091 RepID=A0A8R2M168_BOMMO|nr:guanine nucleotide binding protein isoform X4 [Bombyx mori]
MESRAWVWWLGVAALASARELDPAACVARFDVQRDKIIRTEESREMGARYLSELDVGTRAECLRLCCETEACDVFVYEEKGPGSCYLFKCGPPEDFRCKFTAHSNFSSGVLALSRRLAELQDQEQRAHHERELANLRYHSELHGIIITCAIALRCTLKIQRSHMLGTRYRSGPGTAASTSTTPAPPPPPPPRTNLPLQSPAPTPGRCRWNQFECRRGGECVAVYNACDGVPQCADGSDEPPQLSCPSPPTAPSALPITTVPTTTRHAPPMQDSMDLSVGSDSLVDGDRWPHRLTQAQPPHRYTGTESGPSSHIFSHKGGLLQEPSGDAQFPAFEPPWQRRPWGSQAGVGGMEERGWGAGYPRLAWPEPDLRRAWPVPQQRQDTEMQMYMPAKTMPEVPIVYSSQQQTLRDGPKKGLELPPPTAPPPSPAPDLREENKPPLLENHTKKKPIKEIIQTAESNKAVAREPGGAASARRHPAPPPPLDDHDGLSEHPPAAVLLLVLGNYLLCNLNFLFIIIS